MSWPIFEIQDFCKTGSGATPPRKRPEYFEGDIPWVKSGELRESTIFDTEEKISKEAIKDARFKVIPPGAVLVAMYGHEMVGRVGMLGVEATTNQAVCHVIVDPDRADAHYIFHYIQSKASELASKGVGGVQSNINQSTIRKLKVPLPTVDVQKRIAGMLTKSDQILHLRQSSIFKLRSLGQSIFNEMFGDSILNSTNIVKISEVAKIERIGVNPESIKSGINYVGLEHIESGGNNISYKKVDKGELNSTKFYFTSDHVLFGKLRPYLAKIAVPDFEGVCSTDILPIKPGPDLNRIFLAYFLRQPKMVNYATSRSAGANLPRLSPKALAAFEISLPPLSKQNEFSNRINELQTQRNAFVASHTHLSKLYSTLQHNAFSGEL